QRRLARAVRSHEPDALAARNRPRQILEERLAAEALRDALGPDEHLPHPLDVLGHDPHRHAAFTRPAPCITVAVPFGALVDQLRAARNLHVPVRVVRILYGQRHLPAALKVPVFDAPLQSTAGADRRHVRKCPRVEDIATFRERFVGPHDRRSLSCSHTENAWRTDFAASVPPIRRPMSSVSAISPSLAPWSRTSSMR